MQEIGTVGDLRQRDEEFPAEESVHRAAVARSTGEGNPRQGDGISWPSEQRVQYPPPVGNIPRLGVDRQPED